MRCRTVYILIFTKNKRRERCVPGGDKGTEDALLLSFDIAAIFCIYWYLLFGFAIAVLFDA
jgi:hypothetical protein